MKSGMSHSTLMYLVFLNNWSAGYFHLNIARFKLFLLISNCLFLQSLLRTCVTELLFIYAKQIHEKYILSFNLKSRKRTQRFHPESFLLKCLHHLGLGQAKTGSLEINLSPMWLAGCSPGHIVTGS